MTSWDSYHPPKPYSNSPVLTAKAFPIALNASPAPGAWFLSGWNCNANFRYDFFKSDSEASLLTPEKKTFRNLELWKCDAKWID